MNVLFSNPALLPLVALLTVPLLLHLFARTRPPRYAFSSVTFILRILRASMRVKRPQNWLILLLRTLLFGAIIFMFLQPVFFATPDLADPFQRKSIVLVVDASASMSYRDGAQTRFAAACAEASEVLAGLTTRDTANIIWMDRDPAPEFPTMGVNHGFLRTQLQQARVTGQAGDVDTALQQALKLLAGANGKREICIISDFQAAAWQSVSLVVPPHVSIVRIQVGGRDGDNTALVSIRTSPARPLAGEPVMLSCDVENYSSVPRHTTVYLAVGESRQSQDLVIAPHTRGTAIFPHRFDTGGPAVVEASVGEDAYPGDDRRWQLVLVREHLRVGLLSQDQALARRWHHALDALAWAEVDILDAVSLEKELTHDILLLAGWTGEGTESVRAALERGTTVICAPGDKLPLRAIQALIPDGTGTATAATASRERLPSPAHLRIVSPDDPIFRLFVGGEYGDLSRGHVTDRLRIDATGLAPATPLLAYADGVPALMRLGEAGGLYLWNIALAAGHGTWAAQVEFLPFFGELLLSSREQGRDQPVGADVETGQPVSRRLPSSGSGAPLALVDAAGQAVTLVTSVDQDGMKAAAGTLLGPGVYTWQHQGHRLGYSTVNFPTVESDLQVLTAGELKHVAGTLVSSGRRVRRLREGLDVWPYLLMAAVALVLVEGTALILVERTGA